MAFENNPRTRMNATLAGIGERDAPADTLITTNPFEHAPRHVLLDDGTLYDRCDSGSIADLISDWTAETCNLNEQIGGLKCERDRLRARVELLESTLVENYASFGRFLAGVAPDRIDDYELTVRAALSDLRIEVEK